MFHVVLYQPEIPPNTGNAIRLTANTGSRLHLVKPLGFTLEDRQLARAGLDYHDLAQVSVYENWRDCQAALADSRLFFVSTRGTTRFDAPRYRPGDAFVFGPETRGLPQEMLECAQPQARIRLPMAAGNRSLNLSNAVAVMVFEAWRQNGYAGGA
ncbi:MAG: tRNA (cytidine(34)-2'-O)-methyltransferase [Rhodocyclaceae bacterium]|nr:MAG: tRNA (cytidine(34)-2'-O)-methyltransferase [Rhodocyclaceae bacterium]MBE7424013.1 tRNA (cytidine(34)-2'-O)-methyltransferase [Zoogloeaceae bacterium]MBV6407631.1 tRNA (cytidine(34)-2'-O)-methyltransferase [Rhodocyclaceae bacterium]MCK6383330.1 tRNA (cytidine(34)-2'-O)-methyltransferase [Rhodocyclaceae bacterium]CAG0930227.1 tRNA (cytidine(34)-2'-O)-methyltransferase [Rhodocyclaceae bacterium]